jgi:hypothetical protein
MEDSLSEIYTATTSGVEEHGYNIAKTKKMCFVLTPRSGVTSRDLSESGPKTPVRAQPSPVIHFSFAQQRVKGQAKVSIGIDRRRHDSRNGGH